ncbi:MAG: M14 family metallopeptidase [Phycisphaerales bacterium]|nr:M14 family metallopeptidase [Phycisphaerales bacterium]
MIAYVLACLMLAAPPERLLTVAEKSGYKATARHADVVALLDAIGAASTVAHRASMGLSGEGREIPLLIVADPPVKTAEEAAAAKADGRLLVLLLGNIHAGEVDGKEALPMLARELALEPDHRLLKKLVVVFAPIYNTDGNERVSKNNRPGQIGPEEGMGQRENAAGMDLNRDFIKLECPETRALVKFLNEWDPAIVVDTHTTNGSYHQYVLTYAGPRVPAGDALMMAFGNSMVGSIDWGFEQATGKKAFWYGNFEGAFGGERGHTRWETFPAEGRYGTSYIGLRNRIGILSEAYSYESYEDRVLATREFCNQVLRCAAIDAEEIKKAMNAADARTIAGGRELPLDAADLVTIRSRPIASPKKETVEGFVEELRDGRWVSTGEKKEYVVQLMDGTAPVVQVVRPWGYVFGAGVPELDALADKLRVHGIEVGESSETKAVFEVYRVADVSQATRPFQGHTLARVSVTGVVEERSVTGKHYVVRADQPLGNLIVYLLEPECEDGLVTWNALDSFLHKDTEFPVWRVVGFEGEPVTRRRRTEPGGQAEPAAKPAREE